jgi:glycosyltransferase involved in cell wall biosynthesis
MFPREVYVAAQEPEKFSITIFLGIYNGAPYLTSLKTQLLNQINQDFHLVVVDNDSKDGSFGLIKNWELDFPSRITIVRNKTNLGGSGTLFNSFDLIQTKWFSAFHQDDYYKPDHIEVLLDGIRESGEKIVAVSTVMGSMNGYGKVIGTVPRASMFSKSSDQITAFLENLRVHSVPWPATAFKSHVFERTLSPWHSSSFPDTEQILYMCAYGEFSTINKETMFYRENENSESHSINGQESLVGAALALLRVFNSQEFGVLTSSLDENQVENFALAMFDAIDFRFRQNAIGGLIIFHSLESVIRIRGYRNPGLNALALKFYEALDSDFSRDLFARLDNPLSHNQDRGTQANYKSVTQFLNSYVTTSSQNAMNHGLGFQYLNSVFFQVLPYRIKVIIIRVIVQIAMLFGRFQNFMFKWNK